MNYFVRWVGYPVRVLCFVLIGFIFVPLILVFAPEEWDWQEIRKEWHSWVLRDRDWPTKEGK